LALLALTALTPPFALPDAARAQTVAPIAVRLALVDATQPVNGLFYIIADFGEEFVNFPHGLDTDYLRPIPR